MQKFLRMIWMSVLLFLLGVQYLQGGGFTSVQAVHTVDQEILKRKIKDIETVSLGDKAKKNLIGLYNLALTNLENAQSYAKDTEFFSKALKNTPAEIDELHTVAKNRQDISSETIFKELENLTLSELLKEQEKGKRDLSTLEAKLSDLNNQIVTQWTRPNIARERLIELQRRLDAISIKPKLEESEAKSALLTQAENWVQEIQTFALGSEIRMLDQELLSHSVRMQLLKAKQDIQESEVKYMTIRVRLIDELLNKRRLAALNLIQTKVISMREASKEKHPLVLKLADDNVALWKELKKSTLELEDYSSKERVNRVNAKRIRNDMSILNQKLEIAGMNQEFGEMLIKERALLPKTTLVKREIKQLKHHMTNSGLRQVQYAEEFRELEDIDAYLRALMRGIYPQKADTIYAELKELAMYRQTILDKAIRLEASNYRMLGELDGVLLWLVDALQVYDDFMNKHLLWIRSTKPVNPSSFEHLPEELKCLLSPSGWIEVDNILIKRFQNDFSVSILFFVLVVLLFMRQYFLRAAAATNSKIKSVRTDHFFYTIQSFLYTAMASLPLPLLLMAIGWQLSLSSEKTEFSDAVATALMVVGSDLFYLLYFADLSVPEGPLVKHFRWSGSVVGKLYRELRFLTVLLMPAFFVAIFSATHTDIGLGGTLTMLSIIFVIASLGLFVYRTFTPGGGILKNYFTQNADHLMVRIRMLWGILFVLLMISIVGLALFGYILTASTLTRNLFNTLWIFYPLVLVSGLLARWLLLVKRRLEFQAILTRRAEAKAAKEAMDETGKSIADKNETAIDEDESEVDLVALDAKSRMLLYSLLFSGGAISLWFIWSPMLPAFTILNDISLWSRLVRVDGVETDVPVTLGNFLFAIIIGITTVVSSRGLPALLEFVLLQDKDTTVGGRYTATTLFRYVIIGIGTLLFFSVIGLGWSQIQWLAAALSVGIGFGLQEIVANFISGLIILFERPIRVGDIVTVGNTTGMVTRIQIRATTITNWDRQELVVPNKEFITSQLLNWTLSDRITRVVIPVGIAYGSDVPKAMELLKEAANEHKCVLKSPEVSVAFESFDDSALKLSLRAYLRSVESRVDVISDLHEAINRKFNTSGINIAFPQLDVHLDTSRTIDVRVHREKEI